MTLHEQRDEVTRLNVIKLWDESAKDLDSLALKHFDANYRNGEAKRASTSRLQLALVKVALLLGVRVCIEHVRLDVDTFEGYNVIMIASGAKAQGKAMSNLGFSLGPANNESSCIAVVAHFEFTGEWRDMMDEANWSYKDVVGKSASH